MQVTFDSLVDLANEALHELVASHQCPLWSATRAILVDGKWSVQIPVCNERSSGHTWNDNLLIGYFKGCQCRPLKGSSFCSSHATSATAPFDQARAYSMTLLRPRRARPEQAANICNQDSRKDVAETMFHGHTSAGVLVAVMHCLHIVALKPMCTSEFLTQVLLMVAALPAVFGQFA